MRRTRQPQRPAPVRIMNGDQLAAVVTSHYGEINIRPEAGWKVTQTTINVTMRKIARKTTKGDPTP